MSYKLLVINPGSTSTKIGVYEDETQVIAETLRHTIEEIARYGSIFEQYEFREEAILKVLKEKKFDINTLNAVVGRGGLLKPMEGGTYRVNKAVLEDSKVGVQGQHASNLGSILANEISKGLGIPAFIVDPVSVDELEEVARITGLAEIKRKCIFHALNQKAVAKRYAKEHGKQYEELNFIVAHMGGGITVGAHKKGRVVDVNNAVTGEGPFSPERAGGLPAENLIKMCYSGEYTYEEMKKKIMGKGGLTSLYNSNDVKAIVNDAAKGDQKALLLVDALVYNMSKEIGKCAAVLQGEVDAIIITGGIAYNNFVTDKIQKYVSFIAPFVVYPGEDELLALAQGALRVLSGKEKAKEY